MSVTKFYKKLDYKNPVITQHYGADPFAMVYNGRVYIYMTADKYEYDEKGEIAENTYSKIKSLYVISTEDMTNFEDHGEVTVACDKAAKWAHNSWAPAAAHKIIDGKEKFFLYFADNGGGIGVLSADSPIGPFTDPIGHGLITRSTPTCASVEWLFDPAVIVDDDGEAYIYFGGGVPFGKAANPGTARVCKLGKDMVSLDGDPIPIPDVPFLFEDSGIHKFGNKYYYSYCSNFNVTPEATEEFGFENGEICVMESDAPMGPFRFKEKVLENPEKLCGLGGNNHHCVFNFNGQWYMTYHARSLEGFIGVNHGYRVTHVDEIAMKADGTIGVIEQSYTKRRQIKAVDPYKTYPAACVAQMAGVVPVPADEISAEYGVGNMAVQNTAEGDFVQVQGVDFAHGASKITITYKAAGAGIIKVLKDKPDGEVISTVKFDGSSDWAQATADASVSGKCDLFFVFESGTDIVLKDWKFA